MTTWSEQKYHQPVFRECVTPATGVDHHRSCAACGDTLPHNLPADDPCEQHPDSPRKTFDVVITETIEYYTTVQAVSEQSAWDVMQQQMEASTWEDPRASEVQGQRITSIKEVQS